MTGVPGEKTSPTVRRRELGVLLRALRTERGWTAEQVAGQLLVSPSKISRLERGQRGASARDIRDLCDLYGVDEAKRQRLMELASEGKQRAWWQALSYSEYVGLEAAAASISDFGLGYIPGLLQTLDYARAVAHGAVPRWSPDIVEQSVDARILRQQLLYSERAPRFETAMDESVLHRVVGSPDTMATQLERLVELSQLPHVSIRVIPYSAGALPAGNNKFIILRFAQPTVSDVVFIEGLTEDQYLDDSHDIEVYNVTFRTLRAMAWSDDETRDKMSAMIANYRSAG